MIEQPERDNRPLTNAVVRDLPDITNCVCTLLERYRERILYTVVYTFGVEVPCRMTFGDENRHDEDCGGGK